MSWVYVPGLEDSNSESELPNPERAASLTWRGKPMPPRTLLRAWKTDGWLQRLSGLTLPPSTLNRGVESFIASLRATHANPTASPDPAKAKTTNAGSLIEYSASSTAYGRIVSSERTCRGTQTDNSPRWSQHWKEWATALRQEYSARPKQVPATGENDSSSWPTARANDPEKRGNFDPTDPRTGLPGAALLWGTPTATDTAMRSQPYAQGGTALSTQTNNWPTPAARDHKGQDLASRSGGASLGHAVLTGQFSHSSPRAQTAEPGSTSSASHRTLNPLFVEWLMGWPMNWTLVDPRSISEHPRQPSTWTAPCDGELTASELVAMESAHWLQRMRGELSQLCSKQIEPQAALF